MHTLADLVFDPSYIYGAWPGKAAIKPIDYFAGRVEKLNLPPVVCIWIDLIQSSLIRL